MGRGGGVLEAGGRGADLLRGPIYQPSAHSFFAALQHGLTATSAKSTMLQADSTGAGAKNVVAAGACVRTLRFSTAPSAGQPRGINLQQKRGTIGKTLGYPGGGATMAQFGMSECVFCGACGLVVTAEPLLAADFGADGPPREAVVTCTNFRCAERDKPYKIPLRYVEGRAVVAHSRG